MTKHYHYIADMAHAEVDQKTLKQERINQERRKIGKWQARPEFAFYKPGEAEERLTELTEIEKDLK